MHSQLNVDFFVKIVEDTDFGLGTLYYSEASEGLAILLSINYFYIFLFIYLL